MEVVAAVENSLMDWLQWAWVPLSAIGGWFFSEYKADQKEQNGRILYLEQQMGVLATQMAVQQNMMNNGSEDRKEIKAELRLINDKIDRLSDRRTNNGNK